MTLLLFTVYLAAASGHSPALPCFAAFLALVRFSGLFAFTQLFFQTPANGEKGPFANVNPSKDNWICGFFGISGFYICCVANLDSARVEFVFGKPNKSLNKQAFDELIKHEQKIESALGVTLIWNRNDDVKSSKVYYQLDNVSVENESDWNRIAAFHAEWSKKFYDVIVPLISQ